MNWASYEHGSENHKTMHVGDCVEQMENNDITALLTYNLELMYVVYFFNN